MTGAGSGMGHAVSLRLAGDGAHAAVVDCDGAAVDAAVAAITATGGSAEGHVLDATGLGEIDGLFGAVKDRHHRLDVLHAHVGAPGSGGLEVDEADWDRTVDINMKSAFYACRAAMPLMQDTGSGSIILTASTSAIIGSPSSPLYSMTKGALTSFARSLALIGGPHGIRVNVICPGAVDTPMLPQFVGRDRAADIAERTAALAAKVPLGRIARPEEIAGIVAFLAGDDAGYVTGATIPVDGGRTVC